MDADETRRRRVELIATIVLATAGLGVAWNTYPVDPVARRAGSQQQQGLGGPHRIIRGINPSRTTDPIDITLFDDWIDAYVAENTELTDFYRQRFRDEFASNR
jgi:hypothetical protein